MRNQLLGALIVGTALTFSQGAMAEPPKEHGGKKWEEFKSMTPEQREQFRAERKAKWDSLSKEEKLKLIDERRAQKHKEMDEKWKSMSDDEKIKHVESRMEQKHKGDHKRKGLKKGPGAEGHPPPHE